MEPKGEKDNVREAFETKGRFGLCQNGKETNLFCAECCALALPGIISFNSSTQYYTQDTCLRSPSFKGAESGLKFRAPRLPGPHSFHGVSAPVQGHGWGRAGLQLGVS